MVAPIGRGEQGPKHLGVLAEGARIDKSAVGLITDEGVRVEGGLLK